MMTEIHFISQTGSRRTGQAENGSVMQLAVRLGIHGIEGQCGGSMSCGTCHVRVAPEWIDRVGYASEIERDLLEFEEGYSGLSRLSCQIDIRPDLDGLSVTVMGK
jgi:2Fe-2S ferredoxin